MRATAITPRRWAAVILAGIILLSACAGRSVESFCATFYSEIDRLEDKYSNRLADSEGQDPLAGLLTVLGTTAEAFGDYAVLYDRLEQVAPNDLQPDVAAVRDALNQQLVSMKEAGSDPLGAAFGSLITGLSVIGSEQRVNEYIAANCSAHGTSN